MGMTDVVVLILHEHINTYHHNEFEVMKTSNLPNTYFKKFKNVHNVTFEIELGFEQYAEKIDVVGIF